MTPEIRALIPRKLVGLHLRMSLANNKTFTLWNTFMPRLKEIRNRVSEDRFSLQVYDRASHAGVYAPDTEFEKWAAVEVSSHELIPEGMEPFALEGGTYAVFAYKGRARDAAPTFRFIFETWLPSSGFVLAHRPHFEILGTQYKNELPESEEEIWVPVNAKQ
jgi:AraC family transcriptional regulator